MGTGKPFHSSSSQLDETNKNGVLNKERKYFTLGDEIVLYFFITLFTLPFIAKNPKLIHSLVRQWAGIDGEEAYIKNVKAQMSNE